MQRHWKPVYVKKHQKCPDLDNLVTGVIPAIILENALSEITCKEVSKKITEFHNMTNFSPNSRYVGESLNSYINFKTQYFEKTKQMDNQLRQVFSDIEDPRYIMRDLLSAIFTKKINKINELSNILKSLKISPNEAEKFNIKIAKDGVKRSAFEILSKEIGYAQLLPCRPIDSLALQRHNDQVPGLSSWNLSHNPSFRTGIATRPGPGTRSFQPSSGGA